ncbi:adenosylcobinamide amidohydrolase [Euzebya rosea]|uniref:adenosylcobinamide amidohydrolase n=1 Tax=Euzebya rosea TaxID=2052804 RepID=UPI000D3E3BF1|nr:adenosylcobinamide amidohydrolase [Euzebya rosea]
MAADHRLTVDGDRLVLVLDQARPCVASTIVGGGIGTVRTWLNLEVPLAYDRLDPVAHLKERADDLDGPLVATMTAAAVDRWVEGRQGLAWVVATVGVSVPLAAAGSWEPHHGPGTINIAAVLDARLDDAGLVNAVQTLTEAKAQAIADAGLPATNRDGVATGTATDSILVAAAPVRSRPEGIDPSLWDGPSSFAGPATRVGHDLAMATHTAITAGLARWRADHPSTDR